MRTSQVLTTSVLLALLTPVAVASATVDVSVRDERVDTTVGSYVNIVSTVTNKEAQASERLIAHLNVASLNDVYVDLEDWTASPTQSVKALAPGESTTVSWDIQAVNAGTFTVYAVVLPNGSASLAVSPPVHVEVAGRRTLSAGGAGPVALAVPLLLGAAAYGVRRRLRASG